MQMILAVDEVCFRASDGGECRSFNSLRFARIARKVLFTDTIWQTTYKLYYYGEASDKSLTISKLR